MSKTGSRAFPHIPQILALVAFLAPVAACGILDSDSGPPEKARVLVTGTSVNALEVVTSTRFSHVSSSAGNPVVVLEESDTVYIDPSAVHDQEYPIAPDHAFFVRVTNPDTTNAVVTMKVWIDGKLKYNRENQALWDTSIEYSRVFGYAYQ